MRAPLRQGGFTYLGLIVLVAIIGMVGAAALKAGTLLQRAEKEQELLEIGAAFSDALRSYAAATPPGQPQQPPSLQALLRDPRFPAVRRHLRKIFVDPVTGRAEWGIMTLGDKTGVVGVYSLSQARPLKIGNFDARFVNFDGKERLSDWKFTATGQGTLAQPAPGLLPLFAPEAKVAPAPAVPAAPVADLPSAPSAVPAEAPAEAAPPAETEETKEASPDEAEPPKPPPPPPPLPLLPPSKR